MLQMEMTTQATMKMVEDTDENLWNKLVTDGGRLHLIEGNGTM